MEQSTITVFNFHEESGLWYPSVIPGVRVIAAHASTATTNGRNNGDRVDMIIHCSPGKTIQAKGGRKQYIGPKSYAHCDNPQVRITFRPETDFIYVGAWRDIAPIDDSEMESGLYHHMNDRHDGVYMITSAEYFGLLPHFEIGGR